MQEVQNKSVRVSRETPHSRLDISQKYRLCMYYMGVPIKTCTKAACLSTTEWDTQLTAGAAGPPLSLLHGNDDKHANIVWLAPTPWV